MSINRKRFFQTWELKQQGKKIHEITKTMGFSDSRAYQMIRFVNRWSKRKIVPKQLRRLIQKYSKEPKT